MYSVINKSGIEDRATIYFDELLRMSILGQRKLNDNELDAMSESFKSCGDVNLFNHLLHNCIMAISVISQIENIILKAEFLLTHLRFHFTLEDDKMMVDNLISKALKEIEVVNCGADKKKVKKVFSNLKKSVNESCFLLVSNGAKKRLVESTHDLKEEEGGENFYDEMYLRFFMKKIGEKADSAAEFLKSLKAIDEKLKIKFEVIKNKIEEIEGKIEILKKLNKKDIS